MKYIISKSRFNDLVNKLLVTIIGDITFTSSNSSDYIELYDKNGDNFADIWKKGGGNAKKKCKKTISFYVNVSETIQNFMPIVRKKEFSKLVIQYVYDKIGIKCDCFEFEHSIENIYDDDGDWIGTASKNYHYRKK